MWGLNGMEAVNWEAVGAVGESLGALAVVISLIYLASQIRVQNKESRIGSVHEIIEAFRDSVATVQDRDRAELVARARYEFDELSAAQRIQFIAIVQSILRVWEEAFFQYKESRLDPQIWEAMLNQWTDFFAMDGFQKVWELRRHTYSRDFRHFVASIDGGKYELGID